MASKTNDYQLRQGGKLYIFSTSVNENGIKLSCKNEDEKIYSKIYTVNDLKLIDTSFFNEINSEEETIQFIDKALSVHKVAVFEEVGIIKIVFYIFAKDIIKTVEIRLGESEGDNLENKGTNVNVEEYPSTTPGGEEKNISSVNYQEQNYESANFTSENANAYEQQDFYSKPTITPVEDDQMANNFSSNEYTSQFQTNGEITSPSYEGTAFAIGGEISGEGNQAFESSYQPDNQDINQYYTQSTLENQINYTETNLLQTTEQQNIMTQNEYNISTDYLNNNQYSTLDANNNYFTSSTQDNAANNYKFGTALESNSYTTPLNYEENTNQYQFSENQGTFESTTDYNQGISSTYNISENISSQPLINESLPTITPADEIGNNGSPNVSTFVLPRKSRELSEIEAIRQKLGGMGDLGPRLMELIALRIKIGELNSMKSHIGEIENLRQQMEEMMQIKRQFDEYEALRKKLEEQEKQNELMRLKNAKPQEEIQKPQPMYENKSNGLESKQITIGSKAGSLIVRGEIIINSDELEMITKQITNSNGNVTLNLLYKATADGDTAKAFHSRCDKAKSSVVLVETDKGKRFGGYTSCSWEGDCIDKKDEEAFIFSLDKMKTYSIIKLEDAIGCYPNFGPIFLGCQIRIYDHAFSKGGSTFEKGLNYNTEEDFELTSGEKTFKVKEIEVYEVIKE